MGLRQHPAGRAWRDPWAAERGLQAELQRQRFRGLTLASLRWLVVASVPAWLQVHMRLLPEPLAWLALLAQGVGLAMATACTALEQRWARRAAQLGAGAAAAVVHVVWSDWDELRSALWYATALVSLVPWAYVGFGRPMDASLLSALTATVWTILLLLAAAESVARLPSSRGPGAE